MSNEIKQKELAEMLKETASFCRDARQIFKNLCLELGDNNLMKPKDAITETFFFDTENENGWLNYNFFFDSNNVIKGFRLLVASEDTDSYKRYQQIANKLGIDKNIPLLLIYGCFEPAKSTQMSKDNIGLILDACCGVTTKEDEEIDWINFDKKNINWDSDILVEIKQWTPEDETNGSIAWGNYFSKAKIKYKPLLELRNSEDVKRLANEIKDMTL
jgi:hypothetical protein